MYTIVRNRWPLLWNWLLFTKCLARSSTGTAAWPLRVWEWFGNHPVLPNVEAGRFWRFCSGMFWMSVRNFYTIVCVCKSLFLHIVCDVIAQWYYDCIYWWKRKVVLAGRQVWRTLQFCLQEGPDMAIWCDMWWYVSCVCAVALQSWRKKIQHVQFVSICCQTLTTRRSEVLPLYIG